MEVISKHLNGVILFQNKIFRDNRGYFSEMFNKREFDLELKKNKFESSKEFVQDNMSVSSFGVLRGLHYQTSPHEQAKFVRVFTGSIYDVAVDLRINSKTFGKYVGFKLDTINNYALWIPEGFAHGFVSLEDNTKVHYKTTDYYNPEHEGVLLWNDPKINIQWPLLNKLKLNDRDKFGLPLKDLHT